MNAGALNIEFESNNLTIHQHQNDTQPPAGVLSVTFEWLHPPDTNTLAPKKITIPFYRKTPKANLKRQKGGKSGRKYKKSDNRRCTLRARTTPTEGNEMFSNEEIRRGATKYINFEENDDGEETEDSRLDGIVIEDSRLDEGSEMKVKENVPVETVVEAIENNLMEKTLRRSQRTTAKRPVDGDADNLKSNCMSTNKMKKMVKKFVRAKSNHFEESSSTGTITKYNEESHVNNERALRRSERAKSMPSIEYYPKGYDDSVSNIPGRQHFRKIIKRARELKRKYNKGSRDREVPEDHDKEDPEPRVKKIRKITKRRRMAFVRSFRRKTETSTFYKEDVTLNTSGSGPKSKKLASPCLTESRISIGEVSQDLQLENIVEINDNNESNEEVGATSSGEQVGVTEMIQELVEPASTTEGLTQNPDRCQDTQIVEEREPERIDDRRSEPRLYAETPDFSIENIFTLSYIP